MKIFITLKINGLYSLADNSISFNELHHLFYKPQIDKDKVTNAIGNSYIASNSINNRTKTSAPFSLAKPITVKIKEFTERNINAFFAFEQTVQDSFGNELLSSGASLNNQFLQIENGNESRFRFLPEKIEIKIFKDKTSFNSFIKNELSKEEETISKEFLEKLEIINSFRHWNTLEELTSLPKFKSEFLSDKDFKNFFIHGINTYFSSFEELSNLKEIKSFFEGDSK